MILNKNIFLLLTSLITCSCTDNGFLFRSFGTYETNENKPIIYMIGDPYQIDGKTYIPAENYSYVADGEAGWYSADQDHLITANGEKYDANKSTAMHKTLPLPSIVRVTNLKNGKNAIVRINERGPIDNDRIMDVSEKAAEELDFTEVGTTSVRIEILANESKNLKTQILKGVADPLLNNFESSLKEREDIIYPPLHPINYFIQIGAFSQQDSIYKIKEKLKNYNNISIVQIKKGNQILNRVRVGPFKTYGDAMNMLDKIHQAGYGESKIMSE